MPSITNQKAEKTTTKVRKAMFKMVSIMTMNSISGVGNNSDHSTPESQQAAPNKQSSISSPMNKSLLKSQLITKRSKMKPSPTVESLDLE